MIQTLISWTGLCPVCPGLFLCLCGSFLCPCLGLFLCLFDDDLCTQKRRVQALTHHSTDQRRTGYNPTHRSADLDLLRERLRSRDRCRLRSLPGDPFRSRSLERERLRLRDSRSFPARSSSFLSEESPAIWRERGGGLLTGLLSYWTGKSILFCLGKRMSRFSQITNIKSWLNKVTKTLDVQ